GVELVPRFFGGDKQRPLLALVRLPAEGAREQLASERIGDARLRKGVGHAIERIEQQLRIGWRIPLQLRYDAPGGLTGDLADGTRQRRRRDLLIERDLRLMQPRQPRAPHPGVGLAEAARSL